MNSTAAPGHESQAAQKPQGFRVRLRFCYHLRLKEAKGPKTATNGQQVFKVPADARWVVVPQDFGDGWFAILPLLDNEQASLETTSGLQVNLGRITPSPPNSASHVIDIPERYPAKLLRDAEQDHRQFSRVGHLQLVAPAQDDSKAPYSDAELRYCYTLHFGEADKAHESTVEQPVFDVPYSWHWVLVRKYLRDGSAHVYPTTSHEETDSGSTKPHHVLLGRLFKTSSTESWAQCILERYPEHLMRDAEEHFKKKKQTVDPMTAAGLFKKIDAGSPDHWMVKKRSD